MNAIAKKEEVCYGSPVRGRDFQQEWYETAARTARIRAMKLRKAGFNVSVSNMGSQVTDVGRVNMTMVSIFNIPYDVVVPAPARIVERSR